MLPTHARGCRRPRLLVPAVVVAAVGLAATACGSDGADESSGSGSASASSSAADGEAGGPITVEHAFGTTEIGETPERIVSLSSQWTDVLLALDVQPVGHALDPNAGESGVFPWQAGLSDDSTPIEASGTTVPLERIAALEPDLILASWVATDQATYDSLSGIAPTIPLLGDRGVDPWQDITEAAGEILGLQDEAAQVTADVDQLVADTAAELPGLAGKTFAMVNYVPGDMIYVITDPADGASVFFQDLGMAIDPELAAQPGADSGRTPISLEAANMLDSDLLVIFSNDGDPQDLVGYAELPAVTAGSVAELDYVEVVGLNTPSPLSIPYSLDFVWPALASAGVG
jgi:iron complex transport system substrate-binding protein